MPVNSDYKVSVIVPVYNVEQYLSDCLESICRQTLKGIEIIVVNDGSTDNSLSIIKSFQQKYSNIKLINKKNGGLSSARNAGIDMAVGEYLFFVDSDDFIDLDTLEKMYVKAKETHCPLIICGILQYWSDNKKKLYKKCISDKESIYDAIKNKDYKAIDLKVNIKQPKISTEAAKSVNTLLAEFSTKFSTNDSNRVTNIVLSAKATSDVLLMPGEEFSYNNLTGKRTKSNGYKDAPVIINGKLEQDVGGGVCQVSSTLFNSVLYSGLDVTSRRNHSLKSSYVSIGRDAMVSDGGSDFRFKNPYSHPVYIKNTVSNGVITSKIYGNASDKKNISIKVEPYTTGGLDAAKTYIEYRDSNGNVIRTQYISNSVYKNKNN